MDTSTETTYSRAMATGRACVGQESVGQNSAAHVSADGSIGYGSIGYGSIGDVGIGLEFSGMSGMNGSQSQCAKIDVGTSTIAPRRSWLGYLALGAVLLFWIPFSLCHRLAFWLDEWLYPSLKETTIAKPLFVMGLPRSGTTAMHRYLASQTSTFTTMPLWELIFAPALCQKYLFSSLYQIDQRIRGLVWRSKHGRGPIEKIVHGVVRCVAGGSQDVHPTDLNAPEEDTLGLIPFDGCFLRVAALPFSSRTWRLGYFDREFSVKQRRRMISHYRGLVARHVRFRGGELHYLCKNPGFVSWLSTLQSEFPDAAFVGLRRNPAECLPSQLSSLRDGLKMFGYRVEDPSIVDAFLQLFLHYWRTLERVAGGDGVPRADRPFADEGEQLEPKKAAESSNRAHNFVLVEYLDLIEDSAGVALNLLREFGYESSESDRQLLQQMASRRHQSRHRYDLADFGLTESQLHDAFATTDAGTQSY